ncbi:MAG: HAD family hydrolase [Nocardioides sp.]
MASTLTRTLLVTDLDNTLWDWFGAWHASFAPMLQRLVEECEVPREQLEEEIRKIHQQRGTAEYSNLLDEIPSLTRAVQPERPHVVFDDAIQIMRSNRRKATRLYPGVRETLEELRSRGVRIVAYTESLAYWTEWRIRHTEIDGLLDVLYSSPDHDLPRGMTATDLRTGHYPEAAYGLRATVHKHLDRGIRKPNADVLATILQEQGAVAEETVYVGDSLMKDIAMAQDLGVLDVHAAYGIVQNRPEYELLRRVTHWTDEEVERERVLAAEIGLVTPTLTCRASFAEVLQAFSD